MYFKTEKEIIDAYQKANEEIKPKLYDLFEDKILTKKVLDVNIKPVPPGRGGIAYFSTGSADGRRMGTFYINAKTAKTLIKGKAV